MTDRVPGLPSGSRYGVIDGPEGARIASSLRESIAHYGLSAKPSSTLARMLAAADRLGSAGDFSDDDTEGIRLIGQAQRLAINLQDFRAAKDPSRVVRWVEGEIDRITRPTSQALDFLFEIQIASAFARHDLVAVSSGDPDVLITAPGGAAPVVFECKHPDTLNGAKMRIAEGRRQIDNRKGFGAVAICIDTLIQPSGKAWGLGSYQDAPAKAVDLIHQTAMACGHEAETAFAKSAHLLGLIFVLHLPFVVPGQMFGYQFATTIRHNPRIAGSRDLLAYLIGIAFEGDGQAP